MGTPFRKLLIANRAEIACRVIRTCRDMGIRTVAVCSEVDRSALHVSMADEVVELGGSTPLDSYLRSDKIIDAARRTGADAIHPGYGFLSENPSFAGAVEESGIVFIGPPASAIRAMGDKTAARTLARQANVPTVPGTTSPLHNEEEAVSVAATVGYPVLLKAAAGGGGKGMRVVERPEDLAAALRAAKSEALTAFGDERIYLEKFLRRPRHIEVQVIADRFGSVVAVGERECSIQRRYQKVFEESPSPAVSAQQRDGLFEAAAKLVRASGYVNAGTMEFILDADGQFYFLEMNARLQVEHPVTEMVTGIDLVREQIRIAEGKRLSFAQTEVVRRGHAIEFRLCAEDPYDGFLPSTGTIHSLRLPAGPNVRLESGYRPGDSVSIYYDPLMAKIIAWGPGRDDAVRRLRRALDEVHVTGIRTNAAFGMFVLDHPTFQQGRYDTGFVEDNSPAFLGSQPRKDLFEAAAVVGAILHKRTAAPTDGSVAEVSGQPGSGWMSKRNDGLR